MGRASSGADQPYGYEYEDGRGATVRGPRSRSGGARAAGRRRLALVAAGGLAVVGIGATTFHLVSTTAGSVQGRAVAASTPECQAIHQQIAARRSVDLGAAQNCDQTEFAVLENIRQAARARGEKPAMQISQTCTLVNKRAAQGDATLDFNLAFHCRQRERFANTVNAQNGVGAAGKITSLCQGAQLRQARGETVDVFTRTFCGQEAAAAGGSVAGNAGGAGGGAASKTPAPAASKATGTTAPATGAKAPAGGTGAAQTCTATFVNGGGITANGEQNDPKALIAGSNVFPFGTRLQVTNPDTGRSVTVRINDRNGVFCVAMSEAAFAQIRTPGKNLIRNAQVRVVG